MKFLLLVCALPVGFAGWLGSQGVFLSSNDRVAYQEPQDQPSENSIGQTKGRAVTIVRSNDSGAVTTWTQDPREPKHAPHVVGVPHPPAALGVVAPMPSSPTVAYQYANLDGEAFFSPEGVRIAIAGGFNNDKTREAYSKLKKAKSDDEKEEARADLKSALNDEYDQYLERQEKELAKMEEKLSELRSQMEKRRDAKEDLVELRLQTLENEAMGLGWPGGAQGNLSGVTLPNPFMGVRSEPMNMILDKVEVRSGDADADFTVESDETPAESKTAPSPRRSKRSDR